MRAFLVVLAASLVIGCGNSTPTSPSASTDLVDLTLNASSGHLPGWQNVTLYVWSDDDPTGGNEHLVDVTVHYGGSPSGQSGTVHTGKQGEAAFQLPKSDTSVTWSTDCYIEVQPAGTEMYPPAGPGVVPLPYPVRQNWVLIHGFPFSGPTCP
jgi:hypothetical protein